MDSDTGPESRDRKNRPQLMDRDIPMNSENTLRSGFLKAHCLMAIFCGWDATYINLGFVIFMLLVFSVDSLLFDKTGFTRFQATR